MADNKEEVLIDIRLQKSDNEKQIDNLTKSITHLTSANKELIAENKNLAKTGQENSTKYLENAKLIELNKQKISENTASRKGLIQTIIAEDNSVKGLMVQNANLIKQRNNLNSSTDQGKAAISRINAQLDINNAKIRESSSALEKQKINIGNYSSALDGIVPGMGSFITGMQGMIRASLAFIATPIGAVIGALGLAIGALTAYFKGSEEGQDRLTVITTTLSVAMNKLMVVVEAIGEAIFDTGSNLTTLTDKFGIFGVALDIALAPMKLFLAGLEKIGEFTGFNKIVEDTIKTGEAIAALNDKIEAEENELIVRRAKVNDEVLKLREKAIKQEGDLKEQTIAKAIKLEKDLAQTEKEHLEDKLKAFDIEAETTGRLTEEQKKQRAELLAAIINAESQGAQATIKFQKEIERLRKEARENEIKEREDLIKAEQEQFENNSKFLKDKTEERLLVAKVAFQEELISKEEFEELYSDIEINALEERKNFLLANGKETIEIDKAIVDAKIKNAERERKVKKRILDEQARQEKERLDNLQKTLSTGASLLKQNTLAYRGIASAQATIDTYTAANEALKNPPGPPYTIPLMILTIARGLFNVAKINGVGFFTGGRLTSDRGIPIVRANGDDRLITAKVGEAILTERQQSIIGRNKLAEAGVPGFATGGIVGNETRVAAQNAIAQFDINQMAQLINQVQTVLVLQDYEAKKLAMEATQRVAKIL